ncbi:hypothetical protein BJ138DRAFT_1152909 [Hygrophoropsis aurantiaca]|uniref:Uncharacterized protein n=1 Tax=Hygrophoropsis aurantiaca TaxID=72124 RepID=A0ACB8AB09_9AGAM|nr:hypothetical protein BJ138DRAFT_1152909 [Hygrophoropsis aurantiaca]
MKSRSLLYFLTLFFVSRAIPSPRNLSISPQSGYVHPGRDLIGLIGEDSRVPGAPEDEPVYPGNSKPSPPVTPDAKGLGGLFTSPGSDTSNSATTRTPQSSISSTTHSSPGTFTTHIPPSSTPNATTLSSMALFSSGSVSPQDSKTWKIVGVAIIAVMVVALVVSSVMFFDRLCRFLQEAFCCRGEAEGVEDFVQDWEKGSWNVPSSWDKHASTTIVSIPSETVKEHGRVRKSTILARHSSDPHPSPLSTTDIPSVTDQEPRELPWNAESLRKCALHRQLSQRSTGGAGK